MIEGATLAVFADDWGAHPSSAQHLVRRFLPANRVLWFDTVGLRLPRLTLADGRKIARKLRGLVRPRRTDAAPEERAPRPEVVDLPLAPLPLGRAARRVNSWLLRRAIRERLGAGAREAYVISTLPLTADLVGATGGATFVYYVVDDYGSWPGLGGDLVRAMDAEQARGADVVVAASRALAALHQGRTRRPVEYLPHGVDLEHFAAARSLRARAAARGEPPAYDAVFFGALDERVDRGLFEDVIARARGRRFLAIGPGAEALPERAGLARRPAVSYAELPAVLAECATCLLPYVGGEFGARISPLKAREALAAGLPVVSTDVPEVRALGRGVRIGRSAAELSAALEDALARPADAPSLDALSGESWEARAERLSEALLAARAERVSA